MAARLRELFPEAMHIALNVNRYTDLDLPHTTTSIMFHRIGDYQAGTALLQRIGVGDRRKAIHDENTDKPWTSLNGELEGIEVTAICDTLPPTCRIETVTKRIPKTQTVESGEYVEIQERVVRCGSEVFA